MTDYLDSATVYINIRAGGWDGKVIPANNLFADAIVLGTSLPGSRTGDTNKDSGWEVGEPEERTSGYDSGVIGDQSVWYKFIPASSGYYRFTFSNILWNGDTSFNFGSITAFLYHGTTMVDSGNLLKRMMTESSNPSGAGTGQNIVLTNYLVSGETYYIKVASNPAQGEFNLNAQVCSWNLAWDTVSLSPPANDDFANAELITTNDTTTGSTLNATAQEGEIGGGFYVNTQSIWYKIQPASDCALKITIPAATITNQGVSGYAYVTLYDATGKTDQRDFSNSFAGGYMGQITADSTMGTDAVMVKSLEGGKTYYLHCASPQDSNTFNRRAVQFDIITEELPPVANDDFADATAISGASGFEEFVTAGCGVETDEPPSAYWNGEPQTQGTVWFDWTCPTTGDYVFKVECTIDNDGSGGVSAAMPPNYDLAVWQGSALNALTKVTRCWAGSENTEGRPYSPATAVGFHAVAGQHYKIQVTNWNQSFSDTKLSWRTNTVTGNSTAAALAMPNGRIDNYGNDETEPPPNFATILASHDSWWFNDGQAGHVKWFKAVYGADQTVQIHGRMFADVADSGTSFPNNTDIALIVYKGANYAGLTVAKQTGGVNDAAMMIDSGFAESTSYHGHFVDITGTKLHMDVDVNAGDTLWIAVFGLRDNDTWVDSYTDDEDATQFEVDLFVPTAAPGNDVWADVWADTNHYAYNLSQGKYSETAFGWYYPWAGERIGTTIGATASGEGSIAGFAATRTVYYYMSPDDNETYDFWVESAVDCVLGIYDVVGPGSALGALIAQDDDSGPGDQPFITIQFTWPKPPGIFTGNAIAVVVDSKTEGAFTLKFKRHTPAVTPPANDDFADAEIISSIPFNGNGTTVGATPETAEGDAVELGTGIKDTVWYKYVATFDGQLKIKATCNSNNDDAYVYVDTWRGTTLANLVRHPEPPPTGPGGGIFRGFFSFFDTPAELEGAAITLNVVNGETYYIRVQTESGGSEDFTLYVDNEVIYVNIQASGSDEMHGTLIDDAVVPIKITPSGVERYSLTTDAATVPIKISITSNEFKAFEYVDTGTVYVNITIDSHDCLTHFDSSQLIGYCYRAYESLAAYRWFGTGTYQRFEVIAGDGLEEC